MNPDNQVPQFGTPSASGSQTPLAGQQPYGLPANNTPLPNHASPSGQAPAQVTALHGPDGLLRHTVAQMHEVIAKMAGDPYAQVRELEKIKASYIKAAFGKNIKVADN